VEVPECGALAQNTVSAEPLDHTLYNAYESSCRAFHRRLRQDVNV